MPEPSVFSGWLSPAVLFLLLNLVIIVIALTSSSPPPSSSPAPRAFDRLRSFTLRSAPIPLSPETSPETPPPEETEEPPVHHLDRSQSDAKPTAGELPPRLAVKLRKSASEKSAFAHFKPPENVEEEASGAGEDGGEVDERAGDFIHRFRQQLKLQRLESFIRYKEMLTRSS